MKCKICGSKDHRIIHESKRGFNVLECMECGLWFQDEVHEYKEEYYTEKHKNFFSYDKIRPDYIRAFNKLNRNPTLGNKLLDLGCGSGKFLDYVKSRGWNGKGVEFSKYCVKICKDKGLNVVNCDIMDFETEEKFDIISILDALDHFTNPSLIIDRCKKWLKRDGVIMLTVYNHEQLFDFIRNEIFCKHHLCFFTRESLKNLAEKHGLRCNTYLDNPPLEIMDRGKNLFKISCSFSHKPD